MKCFSAASAGISGAGAGVVDLSGLESGAQAGAGEISSFFSETGTNLPIGGITISRLHAGQSNDWRIAERLARRDLPHLGQSKRTSPTGMVNSWLHSGQGKLAPTSFSSAPRCSPQCLQIKRMSNTQPRDHLLSWIMDWPEGCRQGDFGKRRDLGRAGQTGALLRSYSREWE